MLSKNQRRRQRLESSVTKDVVHSNVNDVPCTQNKTVIKITREQIMAKAKQLWDDFRQYIKTHPNFKTLEDKNKLSIFREKLGYEQFMNEFPIVSRYIVCVGQFNMRAFSKFLDKCEKTVHPPDQMREKGYNEDQWVRRQADYVQYLWEAYQKGHYKVAERQYIWQEAYKRLKGEFDDFRNMHKDIEERVKEEKKDLQAQNARELLERLSTGLQNLSTSEEGYILTALQDLMYKKSYNTVMDHLKQVRKESAVTVESIGVGPEVVPKVTMIETVDADRMHEIDDKYKPEELRGMMVDNNAVINAADLPEDFDTYEIIEEVDL